MTRHPVYLISYTIRASALPEALDDSKEGTGLVFRGVGTQYESLASAEELAASDLALGAFEPQGDLLGLLSLLPEDGLGLASEAGLLGLIAARALRHLRVLALLVLSNLEFTVFRALLAVRVLCLGSVHLKRHGPRSGREMRQLKKKGVARSKGKTVFLYLPLFATLILNIKNLSRKEVFN